VVQIHDLECGAAIDPCATGCLALRCSDDTLGVPGERHPDLPTAVGPTPPESQSSTGGFAVGIAIRSATEADLAAVRDIYNHYVTHSTCTFQTDPDTAAERLAWFRDRSPAHPVAVAELGGEVVGWAALSPWKSRCAYARSAEASVYVRHDLHRRGIGRACYWT
jgi:hypothetical protein